MPSECKLYVGDLGRDTTKKDLEHAFGYYGHLVDVWMPRNSQGFAFVEFEDSRDASDALKGMDGSDVCGARIRVEVSSDRRGQRGSRGGGGGGPRGRGGGRRFNRDDKCYACGEHGHYAYDCRQNTRGGARRRRSRSHSPRYGGSGAGGGGRSYSRSRSRSPSPYKERYSRRSPPRYQRSSRSRSPPDQYSRSQSPKRRNNDYD